MKSSRNLGYGVKVKVCVSFSVRYISENFILAWLFRTVADYPSTYLLVTAQQSTRGVRVPRV